MRLLALFFTVHLLTQQIWNTFQVCAVTSSYDDHQTIEYYCGYDENKTKVREPLEWVSCENPHGFKSISEFVRAGTVFRNYPDSGPISGHISYYQVAEMYLGYACDGVLLFNTMFKIQRPLPGIKNSAASNVEKYGRYGFGHYGYPPVLGMRCLITPLVKLDESNPILYPVKLGTISQCTICDEQSNFHCPTEFDKWYLDAELGYRDGNVCDRRNNASTGMWFSKVESYSNPNINVYLASRDYASLGRDHPFMPGYFCDGRNCTCSLQGPIYPDSLFGGENPMLSLPVTLKSYPHHGRTLGQKLVGSCDKSTVQAVFKITSDDSWIKSTPVEYGGIHETKTIHLEELRKGHLTPGLYIPMQGSLHGDPLPPNYAGLLSPNLLKYRLDNVSIIRCLIDPNSELEREEDKYTQGKPYDCVQCFNLTPCITPKIENGSSAWILDTVINFQQLVFVPGIFVPPGYDLTLLAYNASSKVSPWISSYTLPDPRNATELSPDDGNWMRFYVS